MIQVNQAIGIRNQPIENGYDVTTQDGAYVGFVFRFSLDGCYYYETATGKTVVRGKGFATVDAAAQALARRMKVQA